MDYQTGGYQYKLANHFFKLDTKGNLHVFKTPKLEHLETMYVGTELKEYEVEYRCRQWLNNSGIKALDTLENRTKVKMDILEIIDNNLCKPNKLYKVCLLNEIIQELSMSPVVSSKLIK